MGLITMIRFMDNWVGIVLKLVTEMTSLERGMGETSSQVARAPMNCMATLAGTPTPRKKTGIVA